MSKPHLRGEANGGYRHGHGARNKPSPTLQSWKAMLSRCTRESHRHYAIYGGRGIEVCDRWLDFVNFLADMGERPEGTSLDRIDNDGNYQPGNCRWATRSEQNTNRKPYGPKYELGGKSMTLREWAAHTGIGHRTLYERIRAGWPLVEVFTTKPSLANHATRKTTPQGETCAVCGGSGTFPGPAEGYPDHVCGACQGSGRSTTRDRE